MPALVFPPSLLVLCLHPPVDLGQFPSQLADAAADEAAVGFNLRFSRTTRSDSTGLSFQVLPHTGESGQQVLMLRETHLEPRLPGSRVAHEDVEDQLGAIQNPHLEGLLQIALLGR